jgi:hypothetical protein
VSTFCNFNLLLKSLISIKLLRLKESLSNNKNGDNFAKVLFFTKNDPVQTLVAPVTVCLSK